MMELASEGEGGGGDNGEEGVRMSVYTWGASSFCLFSAESKTLFFLHSSAAQQNPTAQVVFLVSYSEGRPRSPALCAIWLASAVEKPKGNTVSVSWKPRDAEAGQGPWGQHAGESQAWGVAGMRPSLT